MEDWRRIRAFEGYSVSSEGRVRNDRTDRLMTLLRNQQGIVNVGLTKDRVLYKRSVTLLVADAFLSQTFKDAFDTPINLDGDRSNNSVINLMWRPKWFAVKYHRQFRDPELRKFMMPIEEIGSGELFDSSWDAAIRYGLLVREIRIAMLNHTFVWPTYQQFRMVENRY